MRSFSFLAFVILTFCCWGVYGPVLHIGQEAMGEGPKKLSSLRPFICVGFAYFLIAVVYPLISLKVKGEKGSWSASGFIWSFVAGAIGAIGALGIILAFKFQGRPVYVMPLVFGLAPIVNTFVTMLMAGTIKQASARFYLGIIIVAVGAAGVLLFKPAKPKATPQEDAKPVAIQQIKDHSEFTPVAFVQDPKKPPQEPAGKQDPKADAKKPQKPEAKPKKPNKLMRAFVSVDEESGAAGGNNQLPPKKIAADAVPDPQDEVPAGGAPVVGAPGMGDAPARVPLLQQPAEAVAVPEANQEVAEEQEKDKPNLFLIGLCIGITALCWGAYGPVLHKGQARMDNSRLRPFLCVGLAYFAIAVVVPFFLLGTFNEPGGWNFQGSLWSLLAGAAGAVGALGIIYAFNFGGKPIFVMPLVFGFAPVINTMTETFTKGLFAQVTVPFLVSLLMVIIGAVMVLIFAPRGKKPAPSNEPAIT